MIDSFIGDTMMAKGKSVLTTGEVAKICNVAPRTVSKWFDSGQLKGYRIPGSKDRRIPKSELIRFMKAHDIPTEALAVSEIRVLLVDSDSDKINSIAEQLRERTNYEVQTAHSLFDAGLAVQKFLPHVMLINTDDSQIDSDVICHRIRKDDDLQTVKMIAVSERIGTAEASVLITKGFDNYLNRLNDLDEIIAKIEDSTSILY